jgi:adenylate cyclase
MLHMDMDGRTRRQLRLCAALVGAGAGAGLAYLPFLRDTVTIDDALRFAGQGALITSLVFGFEIFVAQGPASEPLRRAPFAVVFLIKALITTALIVTAYGIGGLVLFPGRFADEMPFLNLARDTGYALAVALVLQFFLMVQSIVGGRVLINLILGRYHKPLSEERVFMFLDVSGSTALAEKLGGIGAYSMISRFFFDVAQETARYGGETHDYIGDEVIVTWPLERALEDARCLKCYFAICDRMELQAPLYEREFGLVPSFRVGLHGGPVVAGECGDDKREIVYFGDTINMAARIQEACKEFRRPLLVSGELLRQMNLPPGYRTVGLGEAKLRGREKVVELFTVQRGISEQPGGQRAW